MRREMALRVNRLKARQNIEISIQQMKEQRLCRRSCKHGVSTQCSQAAASGTLHWRISSRTAGMTHPVRQRSDTTQRNPANVQPSRRPPAPGQNHRNSHSHLMQKAQRHRRKHPERTQFPTPQRGEQRSSPRRRVTINGQPRRQQAHLSTVIDNTDNRNVHHSSADHLNGRRDHQACPR